MENRATPVVDATALSHAALRVRDVNRSTRWRQAVLGFEVLTDGPALTPDRTRSVMGVVCGGTVALELLETPQGKAHADELRRRGDSGYNTRQQGDATDGEDPGR